MKSQPSGGEDAGSDAHKSGAKTIVPNIYSSSIYIAPCPRVRVSLGDVPTSLLLGTGSMVTTIFESFFTQHFQNAPKSGCWLQLRAANGLEIPYVGYVEQGVTLFGKVVP